MSAEAPQTTAVAVQTTRAIRVVEDEVAVFSTAHFEHMGRIANVMAETGMLPETLRCYKRKDDQGNVVLFEHEPMVQKARAFMICELADRLSFSPFGLMGACSFVHGKLMLEGKVVAAAIQRKLGVDLDYLFGTWDAKAERTILKWMKDDQGRDVVDPTGEGQGDMLGVVVRGVLPSGGAPREVHGSVGIWKTEGKGSPWRPGAMKRQCSYRGAREWERRHSPGLTLGVTFDDEWDGDRDDAVQRAPRQRARVDLAAKLAAPADERGEGFSAAHIAGQTGGCAAVDATAQDIGGDKDTDFACDECGAPEGAECEPGCSSWDDLDELPPHIVIARAAEAGHDPETGEVRDEQTSDGDGSTPAETGDDTGDEGGGQAEDNAPHQEDDGFPGDKPMSDAASKPPAKSNAGETTALTGALHDFWMKIANATSWLSVKPEIGVLYKTDDWNELEPAEQAAERIKIWRFVEGVIKGKHKDPLDFAQDPSAFRLWMETQGGPEGADAVEGSLRVLQAGALFGKMQPAAQKAFSDAIGAWIKARRAKK